MNYIGFEKISIAARSFGFSLGLAAVIVMPSTVFANDEELEEIVVTARMVEESLQDVPVTVTSIGEETLNAFRIDDAVDLVLFAFSNGNPGDIFVQKSPDHFKFYACQIFCRIKW